MPKGLNTWFNEAHLGDATTSAPCRSCAKLAIKYDADDPAQQVVPSKFHVQDELPKLAFLDENVRLGCEFCGLLLEIVRNGVENDESSETTPISLGDACFYTESYLRTDATGDMNGAYGLKMELRVGGGQPKRLYFSLHADHVSELSIALMQRWIQECAKHPICRLSEKPFVPTRLIDVGTMDSAAVALVEASGNMPGLRYAVLSHCWGPRDPQKPMLKTELSTLAERKDSTEDWQREAALMHQVYKHAHVCIAATSARTSHDGFLERSLSREVRIPFTLPRGGASHGYLHLRQTDNEVMCGFESNVECSTWNDRGWTFQERFLSRRLIHFCKNQAYFECRTTIWAEDNHKVQHETLPTFHLGHGYTSGEELPSVMAGDERDEGIGSQVFGSAPEGNQEQKEEMEDAESDHGDELETIFEHWFAIAAWYSSRQLTYGTDKLIALSGLAKVASSAGQVGRYFAGIWENDLCYGLLWICSGDCVQSPSYRAPSWSWASIDGQIVWGDDRDRAELRPVFDFLDVDIELTGPDVFGGISSARLIISGSPVPVEIGGRDRPDRFLFDFSHHLMYEGRKIGLVHLDLRDPKLLPTGLYALQLFEQYPTPPEQDHHRNVWCGLLLALSDEQPETFRRVGLFVLDEDDLDVFEDLEPRRTTLI
ncbi:hypothetical protein SLS58_009741 [Diplodia intermedia]|uniref:Heterokaryon incompatibility domain-containing protein n=1 Tax=Diplodia intermedia TaxID=856260 RepID=A0ABR3TAR6_9PEZI